MARGFCTGFAALLIALITAALVLLVPALVTQVLILAAAALAGRLLFRYSNLNNNSGIRPHWPPLLLFVFLLAVPGPMFSLAAFLGAELVPEQVIAAALLATLSIFLPGFLLVLAFWRSWHTLALKPGVAGAVAGVNAAVVGLLLAALYRPVAVSAINSPWAILLVIAGFAVLRISRPPTAADRGIHLRWLVAAPDRPDGQNLMALTQGQFSNNPAFFCIVDVGAQHAAPE